MLKCTLNSSYLIIRTQFLYSEFGELTILCSGGRQTGMIVDTAYLDHMDTNWMPPPDLNTS